MLSTLVVETKLNQRRGGVLPSPSLSFRHFVLVNITKAVGDADVSIIHYRFINETTIMCQYYCLLAY
jgi:hypothetical protein